MANEPVNPFGPQQQSWGAMPQITQQTNAPQEQLPMEQFGGLQPGAEGSYFALSPEAMQMMFAPQQQQTPMQPLPPQVNPYA